MYPICIYVWIHSMEYNSACLADITCPYMQVPEG